eukprot:365673-Chlamydomonas_euryale.AAC.6
MNRRVDSEKTLGLRYRSARPGRDWEEDAPGGAVASDTLHAPCKIHSGQAPPISLHAANLV